MSSPAATLVTRVSSIVGKYPAWFETVSGWYDNLQLAKRIVVDGLLAGKPAIPHMQFTVNDQILKEPERKRRSSALHLVWQIPSRHLRVEDNELVLWVDTSKSQALAIDYIGVEQLATQRAADDLPVPNKRGEGVAFTLRLGSSFRRDLHRWSCQTQGNTLTWRLQLGERLPEHLAVDLVASFPIARHALSWDDLWELVEGEVEDLIADLAKELERLEREAKPQRTLVRQELADLKAYQQLHRQHLAAVGDAGDAVTLESIIARSRLPLKAWEKSFATRVVRPRIRGVAVMLTFIAVVAILGVVGYQEGWFKDWVDLEKWGKRGGQGANKQNQAGGPKQQLEQVLQQKKARGGDVQISLFWNNKNDLDLAVICPSKERIAFANRQSRCGGQLDVDMNVGYDSASDQAVENIFWPQGKAPKGRYQVFVRHYRNHGRPGCQDPTAFTVRVVVHGQTRWFQGTLTFNDPKQREALVHEFDIN